MGEKMKLLSKIMNKIYLKVLNKKTLVEVILDKIDIVLKNLTEYNYPEKISINRLDYEYKLRFIAHYIKEQSLSNGVIHDEDVQKRIELAFVFLSSHINYIK